MKRAALGLCVATAFAASLAAQSQQPPATTPQPASPAQTTAAGAAGDITITGCLQKGADGAFTLSNVQQDASATGTSGATAATPAATSTPGAAASAGASAAASSTWALKGGDLAAHVGHRIAVTGKRAMAASSASGATSTSGAAAGAATDPSSASRPAATSGTSASNMRTLELSSVKMVSATCQ